MSEVSVTSAAPISGWDPSLQVIVRCLEALNSQNKILRHDKDRYNALIESVENFLVTQQGNNSGSHALAELAMGTEDHLGFIPAERGIRYLFDAAEDGYLNAQLELAQLATRDCLPPPEYWQLERDGIEVSRERWGEYRKYQSGYWWRAAAENGSADAQYQMTVGLIDSDDPGRFSEGVRWLKRAAYHPTASPGAQFDLAYQMELGRIHPNPADEMYRLYDAAAKSDVSEAMLAVAHYLENGIGVERDAKESIKWYLNAAKWGQDEGYLLAGMLSGEEKHLEMAADAGHVAAMLKLAPIKLNRLYEPSHWGTRGTDPFQEGIDYFQKAADNGNLEAVLALADIYENGWDCGLGGDYPEAWKLDREESELRENALAYYERALELGCGWAEKEVQRLRKILGGGDEEPNQ